MSRRDLNPFHDRQGLGRFDLGREIIGPFQDGIDQVLEQSPQFGRLDFAGHGFRALLMLVDQSAGFLEHAGLLIQLPHAGDAIRGALRIVCDQRTQLLLTLFVQSFQGECPQDGGTSAQDVAAGGQLVVLVPVPVVRDR